jgi:hypothetical protein
MAKERKRVAPTVELSEENEQAIIASCAYSLAWLIHDAIRGNYDAVRRVKKIQELLASSGIYSEITPSIQRALELTVLRNQLSKIVTPSLKHTLSDPGNTLHETIVLDESERQTPLYKEAQQSFKTRTTLNALSMRMYIARLEKQGIDTIVQRVLIRDLNALDNWIKNYRIVFLGDKVFAQPRDESEPRTHQIITGSWKKRIRADSKDKH